MRRRCAYTRSSSRARAAASVRLRTSSLPRMLWTWVVTVPTEINNLSAIAEVAFTSGNLMPELSFGSHFFQDLVEADIFYLALFPENKNCFINYPWLEERPNALEGLTPTSAHYKNVVKVIRIADKNLHLMADVVSQQLLCCYQ